MAKDLGKAEQKTQAVYKEHTEPQGVFQVARQLIADDLIKDKKGGRLAFALFVYLMGKARRSTGEYYGIMIKRGQCLTTQAKLCTDLGATRQEIRTALNRLVLLGYIKKDTDKTLKTQLNRAFQDFSQNLTNGFTLITIVNYGFWQFGEDEPNQVLTKSQPIYKNIKNNKNKENLIKEKAPVPTLAEITAYCQEKKIELEETELQRAHDYIQERSIKNWKRLMQNWTPYTSKKGSATTNRNNTNEREYSQEELDGLYKEFI